MSISEFAPNVYFSASSKFQHLFKNTKSPFGANIGMNRSVEKIIAILPRMP
jgi:hypothetical protein